MTIETYRNFQIRGEKQVRVPPHMQGLWIPWTRELPDGRWTEHSLLCDDEPDALRCARQIVDYDYRVKVWEFLNGREYNALKDGCIEAFD